MNIDKDRILDDFPVVGYQLASRLEDWQRDGTLDRIDHLLVLLGEATSGMTGDELRAALNKFGRVLDFVDGLLQVPAVANLSKTLGSSSQATAEAGDGVPSQRGGMIEVLEQLHEPDGLLGLQLLVNLVSGLGQNARNTDAQ